MFKAIKEFFFGKSVEQPKAEEAPYKVETPAAPAFVSLGEPPATVVVTEEKVEAEKKPAKKPRAKKAEKPATAKKPRAKKTKEAK